MESVKYFKFELDTPSREALKLINEKLKKGVEWGKNKYYYGHSKYYYGSDGSCKKDATGLNVNQIISAKEMGELLSPKKEVDIIKLVMETNYKSGFKTVAKYDNQLMIERLKENEVESIILKLEDPLFEEFKKILTSFNSLEEQFNQVKELFNK